MRRPPLQRRQHGRNRLVVVRVLQIKRERRVQRHRIPWIEIPSRIGRKIRHRSLSSSPRFPHPPVHLPLFPPPPPPDPPPTPPPPHTNLPHTPPRARGGAAPPRPPPPPPPAEAGKQTAPAPAASDPTYYEWPRQY